MNNRCFSSSQLYALRNEISVRMLIEKTLRIPSRVTNGCFRFLCPLCNQFDTAVNPKTNLGRCFRCEKNFNTIDLVMIVRQAEFVGSVKFLQSILQKDESGHDRGAPMTISTNHQKGGCPMKLKTPSAKSDNGKGHIGKIIGSVMPAKHSSVPEQHDTDCKSNEPAAAYQNNDEDRIVKLEQQLEFLRRQIEKIAQIINVASPSK